MGLADALPWYDPLRKWIEPSFPLMVVIGSAIIGVTLWLILHGDPVLLAAWLVYLISP